MRSTVNDFLVNRNQILDILDKFDYNYQILLIKKVSLCTAAFGTPVNWN